MQEHANREADRNPANFWHVATLGRIAASEAPNRIDPPGRAGGQSLNNLAVPNGTVRDRGTSEGQRPVLDTTPGRHVASAGT
jgi:hypothetical protein